MQGSLLFLPGLGTETALFDEKLLKKYLPAGQEAELQRLAAVVESWLRDLRTNTAGETSLEQAFNARIMCEGLGYAMHPAPNSSLWVKPSSDLTGIGTTPDVGLGQFPGGEEGYHFLGVLELKTPGTDLDRPQYRKRRLTPVEQGFEYGRSILGVRWVLVSDMREIRLYSVESYNASFRVNLADCTIAHGIPSPELRKLRFLLHRDCLIEGGAASSVSSLLASSLSQKQIAEEGFYQAYADIRADLIAAVTKACIEKGLDSSLETVLEAVQRLLDRMVFLAYCEDHPSHLISPNTVRDVTVGARRMPGPSKHKVYDALKALFREVDEGSPDGSALKIRPFNGELFKEHPILDTIDLPDDLHDKPYVVAMKGGGHPVVSGAWGFNRFNFWRELDEHLLGSIFERSLSDVTALKARQPLASQLQTAQRRKHGIYYTDDILAEYAVSGAFPKLFESLPSPTGKKSGDDAQALRDRLESLLRVRVIDPTCGSGAFLVSAYRELLLEWNRTRDSLTGLGKVGPDIETIMTTSQSTLLRDCLYGADLLPQAVEIAKLALWLRSATPADKVPDLHNNIVTADSVDIEALLHQLNVEPHSFDFVVGNPPWGGEVDAGARARAMSALGIDPPSDLDSWEMFVLLGLHLLKPGGRLAYILPDTLFAPEKAWIRGQIACHSTIERVVHLGMDWFGEAVRMGAVALQIRAEEPPAGSTFAGFLLVGDLRKKAIKGKVLLSQVEADRRKPISQDRVIARPGHQILVTQGTVDDMLMSRMDARSMPLDEICDRIRGEELSGGGVLWRCVGCGTHTVPPDWRKNLTSKPCPGCGATLDTSAVDLVNAIGGQPGPDTVQWVDTEDIHKRYGTVVPSKHFTLGLHGFPYKSADDYSGPKIFVREAGVGITANLDPSDARCARSMYTYRLTSRAAEEGYDIRYVLGALQSRTMHYYVVLSTNQGDPRRPFANVRMNVVDSLPIPRVTFSDKKQKELHDQIVADVQTLLDHRASLGGPEDLRIESNLRTLWDMDGNDGVYIAKTLSKFPQFGRLAQMDANAMVQVKRARQRRRTPTGIAH
jgi:N-6 DNA Methylase